MEDCLIIGADISNGKSITCITVARKNGENIEIINQLFDKEAEDIYYKLINVNAKSNFSKIKDEAIRRGMSKMSKIYSLKEMLEVLQYTEKLKQYTNKEIKFIIQQNAPKKIKEILAVFWLTHTNDEFFNYFGFNWIPPTEVQEEARKKIDMCSNKEIMQLEEIPMLRRVDIVNFIAPSEIQKRIEKNITLSSGIEIKNFMKGATGD